MTTKDVQLTLNEALETLVCLATDRGGDHEGVEEGAAGAYNRIMVLVKAAQAVSTIADGIIYWHEGSVTVPDALASALDELDEALK